MHINNVGIRLLGIVEQRKVGLIVSASTGKKRILSGLRKLVEENTSPLVAAVEEKWRP